MDAGDARIKVTVQSVQGSGSQSPSKRPPSRTTTIPLRTGDSSPVARRKRQPTPAAHVDSSEVFRRSLRKRKATPVESPRHSARTQRSQLEYAVEEEEFLPQISEPAREARAESAAMYSEQSVPSSEVRRRRSLYPMRNQRYKRLSAAREELDDALQDAISERDAWSEGLHSERGGELTVANEDFTMITGESLASIKASTTMLSAHDEAERSHVAAEHLTSSPPKVSYPDLADQAKDAQTPLVGGDQDVMNWRPTGPAVSQLDLTKSEGQHVQGDEGYGAEGDDVEDSIEVEDDQDFGDDPHDETDAVYLDQEKSPITTNHARQSSNQKSQTSPSKDLSTERDASLGAPDPAADEEEPPEDEEDDDIWAEEASREIDESAASHPPLHSTTVSIPPIFDEPSVSRQPSNLRTVENQPTPAEQPTQRPGRSRLPRTWRQTNGVDNSYTVSTVESNGDQTNIEEPRGNLARRESIDDAESGRSSGVLTPPSTDDDESRPNKLSFDKPTVEEEPKASGEQEMFDDAGDDGEGDDEMVDEEADEHHDGEGSEDEEGDISGFTNPNAGDTQLEAHHRFRRQDDSPEKQDGDMASPLSNAESNVTSPDESGEDTGFFWQTNLPSVYKREGPKPQQRKPIDLSAILRMDSSKVDDSDEKVRKENSESNAQNQPQRGHQKSQFSPLRMRPVTGKVNSTPSDNASGRLLNTPLRKSLLRSSKALETNDSAQKQASEPSEQVQPATQIEESQNTVTDDSMASKASDQRQLLEDFKLATPSPRKPATQRLAILRDDDTQERNRSADAPSNSLDHTEQSENWPEHSYEEHLNIGSPQRINVNFNDSTLSYQQQQTSILEPRRPVRPLFDKDINAPVLKPSVPDKEMQDSAYSAPSQSFFSHEATATPTQEWNESVFSRLNTTFWSAVARPQRPPPTPAPAARTTEQTISLSLRAQLRSRYGVLPDSHPWTMHHMRTLHRLLNSLESGRRDSIVPTHTPLPPHLIKTLHTDRKDATGRLWRCEKRHAYVVQAFLQLLVDPALYRSMQNGEVDWLGDAQAAHLRGTMGGREGSEVCFKTIKPKRGLIEWQWALECLGCCVISNLEKGVRPLEAKVQDERGPRDVEFSIMGDGEGDGRVRAWFERESRVEWE